MTALMLLAPGTPMLFQGQEFASSSPFYYFADHKPDLAKLVGEGRAKFLAQFRSLATSEMLPCLTDPANPLHSSGASLISASANAPALLRSA